MAYILGHGVVAVGTKLAVQVGKDLAVTEADCLVAQRLGVVPGIYPSDQISS